MTEDEQPARKKRTARGEGLMTLAQYLTWNEGRIQDTSLWRKEQCPRCGKWIRSREVRAHTGSDRCTAYRMMIQMSDRGWEPAPRACEPMVRKLGVDCEVGPAFHSAKGTITMAVYTREDVAAICRVTKGAMLKWAVEQTLRDDEFKDALKTIRLFDPKPLAIVAFVEGEYVNRSRLRRRNWK